MQHLRRLSAHSEVSHEGTGRALRTQSSSMLVFEIYSGWMWTPRAGGDGAPAVDRHQLRIQPRQLRAARADVHDHAVVEDVRPASPCTHNYVMSTNLPHTR